MTVALALIALIVGLVIGLLAPVLRRRASSKRAAGDAGRTERILLPFTGTTLSRRALDAAIRIARAEDATLMPAFLATVPFTLPLDSALPRQARIGLPLLEAIEQRASARGVPIDSRVQAGRSYRQALAKLLERERFDRVIIPASEALRRGLSGSDLIWLLTHTDAEVMILRPASQDTRLISGERLNGHF